MGHWTESEIWNPKVPPPGPWKPFKVFFPRRSVTGKYVRGKCFAREFHERRQGGDTVVPWIHTYYHYCTLAELTAMKLRGEA